MEQSVVLDIRNLQVDLPVHGGRPKRVVSNISLTLKHGNVLGIVGESGSGKTMVCSAVLRLSNAKQQIKGSIRFCGEELLELPEARMRQLRGKDMALIMQNPMAAFNPIVTIGAHFIETIRSHMPMKKAEAHRLAFTQIQRFRLPHGERLMSMYPFELSGGMLQRVMIAIAACMNPKLLIADEPTTALDTTTQLAILEELQMLREQSGMSMLLVSHDLGVIAKLADEVAVMRRGIMVEKGPAELLFNSPCHPYTKALLAAREGSGELAASVNDWNEEAPASAEEVDTADDSLVEVALGHWVRITKSSSR